MTKLALIILSTLTLACSSFGKPHSTLASAPEDTVKIASVNPAQTLTTFAFSSCAHQKKPQPIWNVIAASKPDLYVGLGDNVYASKPEDQPIGDQYKLQSRVPEFQKFRSEVPMIATWDDHDFGANDGGAENPLIPEAKTQFLQFFPFDAQKIPADQKGVYHSFVFGEPGQRVQFILLDTRSYRSPLEKNTNPQHKLDIYQPTKDTTKTILGSEQWTWLEKELKTPAEVRILVSSIQVISEEHGFEKWANFPHERKRLFELLKKTKARNVVILSGDRHMSEVSQIQLPGLGKIYDITASSINRPSNLETEANSHRVGPMYTKESFGLARIDWGHRHLTITLEDITGKTIQEIDQKLQ